jgi:hypothetical protein
MVKSVCFPITGKLQDMVADIFIHFYVYSTNNEPQSSWGTLQIGIISQGSTSCLYGLREMQNW